MWISDLRGFGLSVCEGQSKRVSVRTWFFRSQQRTEREREKQSVCVRKEKKDGLSGAHIRPYVIVWKIFDSVMPCVSGLIYEYDTVSERV